MPCSIEGIVQGDQLGVLQCIIASEQANERARSSAGAMLCYIYS